MEAKRVSLISSGTAYASRLSDRLVQTSLSKFAEELSGILGLPRALVEVLLLVEDKRFATHIGVDFFGVVRALLANPRKNVLQGASTISQQIFTMRWIAATRMRPDRTVLFKIQQAFWAICHENSSCKVDILTEYVNNVYLGSSHRGLERASLGYFGIPVSKVSAAQAFFLAERIGSPNFIRPGRLLNLMARIATQGYFLRFSTTETSVVEVYRSVYGNDPKLQDLHRRRDTAEEVKARHVLIAPTQLEPL
jgi:membrane peptidoglycan carboxypeptidase